MVQAQIHLDNILANAATFKRLAPNSKLLAVVKANAYGHGACEVASSLSNSADAFAVARLTEAQELQSLALDQSIVIMSEATEVSLLESCASNGFDVVIHSLEAAYLLANTPLNQAISVWLKIDTGMHRLGLYADELAEAMRLLENHKNVTQLTLMTHLACADATDSSSYETQLAQFETVSHRYDCRKSIANSAASLRNSQCHADWIRPGIGLYGENPLLNTKITGANIKLLPTMTLSAPVIALRSINTGESVGYGDTWQAQRDSVIATVAIGYADGYPRALPNGTPVMVNGFSAALVGRVSMDMISIDVTDIDTIEVGDSVELWGKSVSASHIAALANTIPYTLFCGLGSRVKRHFD